MSAANVGVSPASLRFDDVLRGGYSEKSVLVSVDVDEYVLIELQPMGEIKDWINFSEVNFSVKKSEPYRLFISVNPPEDVPNGNYSGFLRIKTGAFGTGVKGHAVGVVRSNLDLKIDVSVTDVEIVRCSASNFNVESVEKGDNIVFSVEISNTGNVRLKPNVVVDIWDRDQISIVKKEDFLGDEILPSKEEKAYFRVDSDTFDTGQYWSDISVIECYASKLLTFDILDQGALKAEGSLLGIVTKRKVKLGERVPISVKFKNTGEKEVEAYFKGRISLGDELVQILESDKLLVPISETSDFNFYYAPGRIGRYTIDGRVFYSSKRTFESSAIFEVFSERSNYKNFLIYTVYITFIFLILFLFYKIRKERRLLNLKLKNLKLK
ncbi:hypothetical protein GF386_06470 [Candidatus Pacearchaeota archaeon]|nr:hypothetical protein [Candidatus Pacearchaeota archaeon]MBD3283736.1 hypothetical protein [Candidatus Pacearchaeota archaeon]